MPKPKWKLNTIYISERLQESLRPISRCALTTVVAPMGYGKTTAVNWYLEERAKPGRCASSASACIPTILRSSGGARRTPLPARASTCCGSMPVPRMRRRRLLADDLCHELAGKRPAICSSTIFTCSQTNA